MRKNLISLLSGLFLGAASLLPIKSEAGYNFLRVLNTSTNQTQQNRIEYTQGGTYGFASTNYPKNLKIYDATTSSNTIIPVNITTNNSFTANLAYTTNTANNAENTLKFKFFDTNGSSPGSFSTFPSNTLITAQILRNGTVYTNIDVIKLVRDAGSASYEGSVKLPNINTNFPNPYATLKMSFATKESAIPEIDTFTVDSGTATIRVSNVLPGENIVLDSKTNITDSVWTPTRTNYVEVTPSNFGTTTSTTFSNVTPPVNRAFYRARVQ